MDHFSAESTWKRQEFWWEFHSNTLLIVSIRRLNDWVCKSSWVGHRLWITEVGTCTHLPSTLRSKMLSSHRCGGHGIVDWSPKTVENGQMKYEWQAKMCRSNQRIDAEKIPWKPISPCRSICHRHISFSEPIYIEQVLHYPDVWQVSKFHCWWENCIHRA